MSRRVSLLKKETSKLLAEQEFNLVDETGGSVVCFGMDVANRIAESYHLAELQLFIVENYGFTPEDSVVIAIRVTDMVTDTDIPEEEAIEQVIKEVSQK